MKSMGHVAYDAFRAELGWLLPWHKLPEDERQRWNQLAQGACNLAEAEPVQSVSPEEPKP